jgi:branched-chain amino acid transport system substrate-binding protein
MRGFGVVRCRSGAGQQVRLSEGVAKIGVLADLSSVYSSVAGQGAVEAVRMAVTDFMKDNPGMKVEVIFADHQNKADIAASKAREWFDTQQVDMARTWERRVRLSQ